MQRYQDRVVEPSKASITSLIRELQVAKSIHSERGYQLIIFSTVKFCRLTQILLEALELEATQYHQEQASVVVRIQELEVHHIRATV